MTEARLKQWVAGELDPQEQREVARWMVRCTDSRLPDLLLGMLREQREAAADAVQGRLGGAWQKLTEVWATLLDAGTAGWVQPGMGLQTASLTDDEQAVDALILTVEGEVAVAVTGHLVDQVIATDSRGTVTELMPSTDGLYIVPSTLEERPTIWVVRGWSAPIHTAEQLHAASMATASRITALRWRD